MLLPSISSVYGIEKITNQRAVSLANLSLLYKNRFMKRRSPSLGVKRCFIPMWLNLKTFCLGSKIGDENQTKIFFT